MTRAASALRTPATARPRRSSRGWSESAGGDGQTRARSLPRPAHSRLALVGHEQRFAARRSDSRRRRRRRDRDERAAEAVAALVLADARLAGGLRPDHRAADDRAGGIDAPRLRARPRPEAAREAIARRPAERRRQRARRECRPARRCRGSAAPRHAGGRRARRRCQAPGTRSTARSRPRVSQSQNPVPPDAEVGEDAPDRPQAARDRPASARGAARCARRRRDRVRRAPASRCRSRCSRPARRRRRAARRRRRRSGRTRRPAAPGSARSGRRSRARRRSDGARVCPLRSSTSATRTDGGTAAT